MDIQTHNNTIQSSALRLRMIVDIIFLGGISKMGKAIYLLYDGDSPDGRGTPDYIGKTTSKERARKHLIKVKRNPYSTGKVEKLSGKSKDLVWGEDDL